MERRLIGFDLSTSGTGNFHFSPRFWQAFATPQMSYTLIRYKGRIIVKNRVKSGHNLATVIFLQLGVLYISPSA